jgi:hypothetical protein
MLAKLSAQHSSAWKLNRCVWPAKRRVHARFSRHVLKPVGSAGPGAVEHCHPPFLRASGVGEMTGESESRGWRRNRALPSSLSLPRGGSLGLSRWHQRWQPFRFLCVSGQPVRADREKYGYRINHGLQSFRDLKFSLFCDPISTPNKSKESKVSHTQARCHCLNQSLSLLRRVLLTCLSSGIARVRNTARTGVSN